MYSIQGDTICRDSTLKGDDSVIILTNRIYSNRSPNSDMYICVDQTWDIGIILNSSVIYFYVAEFIYRLPSNKNRYEEIKSMMISGEVDVELCDFIWKLYLFVKAKGEQLNRIYDYIPSIKHTGKFDDYDGIRLIDNYISTEVSQFNISDDFVSLIKNGLCVKEAFASIYEQIDNIMEFAPTTKSAK